MYTHYIVTRILGIWIRYILYAYGFMYRYVVRMFEGGGTVPTHYTAYCSYVHIQCLQVIQTQAYR